MIPDQKPQDEGSTAADSDGGHWIHQEMSYVNPRRESCAMCGRPLARRVWQASPAGEPLLFCEPSHAALYLDYWLPLYE